MFIVSSYPVLIDVHFVCWILNSKCSETLKDQTSHTHTQVLSTHTHTHTGSIMNRAEGAHRPVWLLTLLTKRSSCVKTAGSGISWALVWRGGHTGGGGHCPFGTSEDTQHKVSTQGMGCQHRAPSVSTGHEVSPQGTKCHHRASSVCTGHAVLAQGMRCHHRAPGVTTGHQLLTQDIKC